jgi:hypothetical protein
MDEYWNIGISPHQQYTKSFSIVLLYMLFSLSFYCNTGILVDDVIFENVYLLKDVELDTLYNLMQLIWKIL